MNKVKISNISSYSFFIRAAGYSHLRVPKFVKLKRFKGFNLETYIQYEQDIIPENNVVNNNL